QLYVFLSSYLRCCFIVRSSYSSACHLDYFFFFFIDTPTTEIYTLSLHDALPIWLIRRSRPARRARARWAAGRYGAAPPSPEPDRSEEHTSELQSRGHLVCRLLLEKKKKLISLLNVAKIILKSRL